MFKRTNSTGSENDKKEYEFLFNTMTQGVVFQNHKGEITKINTAAEELLGASFEQLSGKTSMDPRWKAIYPDGKPFHGVDHPAMVALRTGQAVKNVEMGVFHPKKQAYNWLLVSAHPIFDNNSTTPTRVFASFADITNQKLVEKQLINQQKQERILANNLPGIGYIQDAQFNLEYVNNKIFEVYELPLDSDITNFSLESLIHLEDLERVLVERSRALSERKHFEIEYRIVVNNNKIKHVIDSGEGIFENNKLIRVVGFIRDITKNKSIITQLESTISILKESGKVAKIGYWEADMLSGSLFWLPETYRLFERDPNQPPEMKDVFKYYKNNEVLEKAIESAISEGIDYDIETEIETSTGKTRWFRTVGKTIFDNNACSKIYGLVQDITDQRNALEELRHQFQLQELLLDISNTLIKIDEHNLNPAIDKALQKLGTYANADRFYIFDFNEDSFSVSNSFEWCATGVEPQIEHLQNIPMDGLDEWLHYHQKGLPFIIKNVLALPEDSVAKSILEPQDIKSIATFPLFKGEKYAGFIGLDYVKDFSNIRKDDIELLKLFAKLLDNVFERVAYYQNLFYYKNLLNDVVENSGTVIYKKDNNGKYELVNKSWEFATGLHRDDVIGKTDHEVFKKEIAEQFSSNDAEVFQTKKTLSSIEFLDYLGKRRYFSTTKFPVVAADDTITGVAGLSHDITKEKEIQFSLQRSEAMLTSILNTSNASIWSIDKEYKLVFFNKNFKNFFKRFYGFEPEIQSNYLELLPAAAKRYWKTLFESALNGKTHQFDSRKDLNDGSFLEFIISIEPVIINKKIAGASIFSRDVTIQKKNSIENVRFSKIFDETLNEIFLFDIKSYRFKQANPASLRNLGYTQEELHNLCAYDIKPEYSKAQFELIADQLKENKSTNLSFETFHQRKDGSTYPVEIYLQVVTIEKEQFFMAFANDISDKKMYLQKLEKQNEILRNINWTQSHVVRMPLTRIMGLTMLLENQFYEDLSFEEIIEEIKKSTKEIDVIIKNIVMRAHEAKHIDEALNKN